MKIFWKYTVWVVAGVIGIILCGCASSQQPTPNVVAPLRPSHTSQPTQSPTLTPSASATPNPGYQEIVAEIFRLVDEYNAKVEQLRQAEGAKIVLDPQTGEERLELRQAVIDQLIPLYDDVSENIQALDQEYWLLYEKEHTPDLLPTNLSKPELKQLIVKLRDDDFNLWVSSELKNGTVIKLFDPGQEAFIVRLIGESSALYRWKWAYIVRLMALYAAPAQELMTLDIQAIQRIEPGEVVYKNRSSNPAYRTDLDLTTYETATARYDVYTETHEIIEIVAKSATTDVLGDRAALEKRARELVALISPGWNIENLTFSYAEKINTYFFRWTDMTKPLLDDGRTYPFIQVGLNGNGELLNYYNTLPLSR